jgi:hypothetical protein
MRVVISVPDSTFAAAERVARRLGMSRSTLYTRAVQRFIEVHQSLAVRQALAAVYEAAAPTVDPVIDHLQAEALSEEW